MKSQLSAKENNKLVAIKSELNRLRPMFDHGEWPRPYTPLASLAHAYGVGVTKVKGCVVKHYRNNCSTKRKERSDAGDTLFNSAAKRNKLYTPYNHFKKLQRKQNPGERILADNDLKEAWSKCDEAVRHRCWLGAEEEKLIAANIVGEIKKALQKTNGSISWERLAVYVAGGEDKVQPVSRTAIAKYVMATEGFHYFETRTLPQCTTEHTKRWRMEWATSFFIFWEGAKLVASKVQIVYFHIDEKWFYLLVIRKNNKAVPVWGVQGVFNRIHHKSAIDKILAICGIAYVPHSSDLRRGGTAKKLTITRCGDMVEAKKDSYKRVYNKDGTGYTYPKVPENLLRRKGELYFENQEITGSKEVVKGERKFALTKWLRDTFMVDLVRYCQYLEAKLGKRIHVRGQWDNASPDTKLLLLALMQSCSMSEDGSGRASLPTARSRTSWMRPSSLLWPSLCRPSKALSLEAGTSNARCSGRWS